MFINHLLAVNNLGEVVRSVLYTFQRMGIRPEVFIPYLGMGLVFAFICSSMADAKNRDKTGWAIAGFLLGIIAAIILAFLPTEV